MPNQKTKKEKTTDDKPLNERSVLTDKTEAEKPAKRTARRPAAKKTAEPKEKTAEPKEKTAENAPAEPKKTPAAKRPSRKAAAKKAPAAEPVPVAEEQAPELPRQHLCNSHRLSIQIRIYRFNNCRFQNLSSSINDKLDTHSAFNAVFLSSFRICDVLANKLVQSFLAANEFRHLFNRLINHNRVCSNGNHGCIHRHFCIILGKLLKITRSA